jgi:hypothetical protein
VHFYREAINSEYFKCDNLNFLIIIEGKKIEGSLEKNCPQMVNLKKRILKNKKNLKISKNYDK